MAFKVEISPKAFREIDDLAASIKNQSVSFSIARRWFLSILVSIDSLSEMPERCQIASLECPGVRVLFHGKGNRAYKIYFAVRKERDASGTVSVLHVRHGARKPLTDAELGELMDDQGDPSESR